MINLPIEINTVLTLGNQRVTGKLNLLKDGSEIELDNSSFSAFTITRSMCANSSFTLGSTVATTLTVSLLNTSLETITGGIDGARIDAYLGYFCPAWSTWDYTPESGQPSRQEVFEEDPTAFWKKDTANNLYIRCLATETYDVTVTYYEVLGEQEVFLKQGQFYVDGYATEEHTMFTDITAYDVFMDKSFDSLVDEYMFNNELTPKANLQALADIVTAYTFDLSNIPNTGTTHINITKDMTLREIVSRLAIFCGFNCTVTPNGTIAFVKPHTTVDYEIDTSSIKSFTLNTKDVTEIAYVEAEFSSANDNWTAQYPNVASGVGVSFDNTFFYEEETLETLWININNGNPFTYIGHSVSLIGMPFVEPFDCIDISYFEDNALVKPFTVKQTYNGGLVTDISASEITSSSKTNASTAERISVAMQKINTQISSSMTVINGAYANCTTAGATADKVADVVQFVPAQGAKLKIKFAFENTADNPTITVQNTDGVILREVPILINTFGASGNELRQLKRYDSFNWEAGQIVNFTYLSFNGFNYYFVIEENLAANFIGVEENTVGKKLVLSTDPNGISNVSSYRTELSADSILMRRVVDGSIQEPDVKISQQEIILGADELNRTTISPSGILIRRNTNELQLSDYITLQGSNTFEDVREFNQLNQAVLTGSQFISGAMYGRSMSFYNSSSTLGRDSILTFEKRKNGHLSLKVSAD